MIQLGFPYTGAISEPLTLMAIAAELRCDHRRGHPCFVLMCPVTLRGTVLQLLPGEQWNMPFHGLLFLPALNIWISLRKANCWGYNGS